MSVFAESKVNLNIQFSNNTSRIKINFYTFESNQTNTQPIVNQLVSLKYFFVLQSNALKHFGKTH